MLTDAATDVAPSEWHSVRPWSARMSLSVREITSVSVTFILASTFSDRGVLDVSLDSLGLEPDEDTAEGDVENDEDDSVANRSGRAIIADALAKGLSVNVNGNPWSKVIFHVDDKMDEAIIIIYALMPGRQYDIDLGLVQGGQSMRRQVVTGEPAETTPVQSPEASLPTPPTPSNPTVQVQTVTLEERLAQLQGTLASLNSEHETLSANLKVARRDSQKADAALRSEIDILKRTSEKNAASELRARQKVLALQEAVKRAQAATTGIQDKLHEVEEALPGLREQRKLKEEEYAKVKALAERKKRELEKENEIDKKKIDTLKGELTGLGHRMDKLNGKKEKLEGTVIPDLEAQLREVEEEIEKLEMESHVQASTFLLEEDDWNPNFQSPGIISRPHQQHAPRSQWTPARPSRRSSVNSNHNPVTPVSSRSTPGQQSQHSQNRPSHHRSHSGSGNSSHPPPNSGFAYGTSPTQLPNASNSTLSSKAPPFEPGRFARTMSYSHSNSSSSPSPIQRPHRNAQHGSKDSLLSR
ncbi:hypothetical protein ONZ45_g16831 [Pleurotus djamor]|nr:hypothetical protein ONZ45_g16831 [Pleurotus djamor]